MYIYKANIVVAKINLNSIDSMRFKAGNAVTNVSDIDGNTYATITLGSQIWMKENLKTTQYKDGTPIVNLTDKTTWAGTTQAAYCLYENNSGNKPTYGVLYNYYAVASGKVCPTGWHVPSDSDWSILINYLAGNGYNYNGSTSGDATAKSLADNIGWGSNLTEGAVGNTDFTAYRNKTGYKGKPAGFRYVNGDFGLLGFAAYWWTSTPENTNNAWCRGLYYSLSYTSRDSFGKKSGASIRCIKD